MKRGKNNKNTERGPDSIHFLPVSLLSLSSKVSEFYRDHLEWTYSHAQRISDYNFKKKPGLSFFELKYQHHFFFSKSLSPISKTVFYHSGTLEKLSILPLPKVMKVNILGTYSYCALLYIILSTRIYKSSRGIVEVTLVWFSSELIRIHLLAGWWSHFLTCPASSERPAIDHNWGYRQETGYVSTNTGLFLRKNKIGPRILVRSIIIIEIRKQT